MVKVLTMNIVSLFSHVKHTEEAMRFSSNNEVAKALPWELENYVLSAMIAIQTARKS